MEIISEDKLRYLAGKHGFNLAYLEKDYFLTLLLYFIKDINGIYFKSGTALNKVFLNHTRLSEDLDFSSKVKINSIKDQIETKMDKDVFPSVEIDHFTKDFIRYHVFFNSYFEGKCSVNLDLNSKASIHLRPELHKVRNFYGLDFQICTLNIEEIIAEKLRSLILRNQPRDYFDLYFILKRYKINFELVKTKLKEANSTFNKEKIFKRAQKLYSRWEKDLLPLTNRKIGFVEVIKFLQKRFKYKV